MLKWSIIVVAFALGASGTEAADVYGYQSRVGATGPSYTTVYVDPYGRIVGVHSMGPVTPYIGAYGEPLSVEMLPHGAMSFGSVRVVPAPAWPRRYLYGPQAPRGY